MSILSDVDKAFDEIERGFDIVLERVTKLAQKEVNSAIEKIYKEFGVYQQERIQQIFTKAIDDFYSDYSPTVYKRQKSLYGLLNIPTNGYGMFQSNDPDYMDMYDESAMTKDRRGGSLFHTVFELGYHGGAMSIDPGKADVWGVHPAPGTPYYRKRGIVQYPNGVRKWHRYGKWGRRAVLSVSPAKVIAQTVASEDSDSGKWDIKFEEITLKNIDAAKASILDGVSKIYTEVFG